MATKSVLDLILNDAKRDKCEKCGRLFIQYDNLLTICPEFCLPIYLQSVRDSLERTLIKPIVCIVTDYLPHIRYNLSFIKK